MKLFVILAGAVAVVAMGPAVAETPKKGGNLKFAVVAEPPTLDCHAVTTFAFAHPVRPHYSTLLRWKGNYPKTKIEGDLAQSWEMAKDGLSYTLAGITT